MFKGDYKRVSVSEDDDSESENLLNDPIDPENNEMKDFDKNQPNSETDTVSNPIEGEIVTKISFTDSKIDHTNEKFEKIESIKEKTHSCLKLPTTDDQKMYGSVSCDLEKKSLSTIETNKQNEDKKNKQTTNSIPTHLRHPASFSVRERDATETHDEKPNKTPPAKPPPATVTPKPVNVVKIPKKVYGTPSKSKTLEFKKLFGRNTNDDLIEDFSCALYRDILIQGRIYVTKNAVYFYAKILGWETAFRVRLARVVSITKQKTALIIPNAIQIRTKKEKFFFASFSSRDKVYLVLFKLWQDCLSRQSLYPETVKSRSNSDVTQMGKAGRKQSDETPENVEESGGDSTTENKILFNSSEGSATKKMKSLKTSTPKSKLDVILNEETTETIKFNMGMSHKEEKLIAKFICDGHEHYDGFSSVNETYDIPANVMLAMLFTNCTFFRSYYEKVGRLEVEITQWFDSTTEANTEIRLRTIKYKLPLSNAIGPKICICMHDQYLHQMIPSSTGNENEVSWILNDVVSNKEVPYADCFKLYSRFCIRYLTPTRCNLLVTTEVRYTKSVFSIMKALLESNMRTGIRHTYITLKDFLCKVEKGQKFEKYLSQYIQDTPQVKFTYKDAISNIVDKAMQIDSLPDAISQEEKLYDAKSSLESIMDQDLEIDEENERDYIGSEITNIVLYKMRFANVIEYVTRKMGQLEEQNTIHKETCSNLGYVGKLKALPVKVSTVIAILIVNFFLTFISISQFTKNWTVNTIYNLLNFEICNKFVKLFSIIFVVLIFYSAFNMKSRFYLFNFTPREEYYKFTNEYCQQNFNLYEDNTIDLSIFGKLVSYIFNTTTIADVKLQALRQELNRTYEGIRIINFSLQRMFKLMENPD